MFAVERQPEIEVRFWPFKLLARGDRAIAAVRWPLAVILVTVAIAILAAIFLEAYWGQHELIFKI
jgi:hypothetical protein